MIPGENGYDFEDQDQFRQGLDRIFADPAWLPQAAERSAQVASRFGKEAFGESVEAVYELVLQDGMEEMS